MAVAGRHGSSNPADPPDYIVTTSAQRSSPSRLASLLARRVSGLARERSVELPMRVDSEDGPVDGPVQEAKSEDQQPESGSENRQ